MRVADPLEEADKPEQHIAVYVSADQVRVRLGQIFRKATSYVDRLVATGNGALYERVLTIPLDRVLQPRLRDTHEGEMIDGHRSAPRDPQATQAPDVLVILLARIQFLDDHCAQQPKDTDRWVLT